MKQRVALYSLGIGIAVLGTAIFRHSAYGAPIRPEGLWLTPLISLACGYVIWLRWDWAPEERRKTLERRAQEKRDQ